MVKYVLPDLDSKYSSSDFTHAAERIDASHRIRKQGDKINFSEVLNNRLVKRQVGRKAPTRALWIVAQRGPVQVYKNKGNQIILMGSESDIYMF